MTNKQLLISAVILIVFTVLITVSFTGKVRGIPEDYNKLYSAISGLEDSVNSLRASLELIQTGIAETNNPDYSSDLHTSGAAKNSNTANKDILQAIDEMLENKLQNRLPVYSANNNQKLPEQVTTQHETAYNDISMRLYDPVEKNSITFQSLLKNMEEDKLPRALRKKLMDQVTQMLNDGQLDEHTFLKR